MRRQVSAWRGSKGWTREGEFVEEEEIEEEEEDSDEDEDEEREGERKWEKERARSIINCLIVMWVQYPDGCVVNPFEDAKNNKK